MRYGGSEWITHSKQMKKLTSERFARLVKTATGAVIGAAVIAVFCRSCVPLKNSTGSDIVSGTRIISTSSTSTVSEHIQSSSELAPEPPESDLININTATSAELQALTGIGEAKAAAIIAYREEHGVFADISEIMNVSGIGEKIFESIRDSITTGEVSAPNSAASQSPASEPFKPSETILININTATAEELQTLSGIGEAKAAAIIAYREEHGAFDDISEIMNVSGIGEKIFESIRENITV